MRRRREKTYTELTPGEAAHRRLQLLERLSVLYPPGTVVRLLRRWIGLTPEVTGAGVVFDSSFVDHNSGHRFTTRCVAFENGFIAQLGEDLLGYIERTGERREDYEEYVAGLGAWHPGRRRF